MKVKHGNANEASEPTAWPVKDLPKVTSFHLFFLPSASVQYGAGKDCTQRAFPALWFYEIAHQKKRKKKKDQETESMPEREIVCVFFFSAKSDHKKH